MTSDDREHQIRQRAHELWVQAGRPEGHHAQHWEQAATELGSEPSLTERPSGVSPLARRVDADGNPLGEA